MPIYNIKGNLLNTHCQYICHQVNCQGKMNSGIAKSIREKWPIVYENYMAKYNEAQRIAAEDYGCYENVPDAGDLLLGTIQFVPLYDDYNKDIKHQQVINIFGQYGYGYDGKRYTSYDAFWECLNRIAQMCPKGSKIGFPYRIGCGLGGANWPVIETMIYMVLGKDFDVYIYCLEDEKHD